MDHKAQMHKWRRRRERRYLRRRIGTLMNKRAFVMHCLEMERPWWLGGNRTAIRTMQNALVIATARFSARLVWHGPRYRARLRRTSRKWGWRDG